MANRDADWVINTYDDVPLGQILVDERLRYLMIQRHVAEAARVKQSSLSAYEHCRVTPSWDMFVRILKAMDRKAVIRTEPLDPDMVTIRSVRGALEDVLKIIDGRPYRLEGEAAAHVLGRSGRFDTLRASVEADAATLDEIAESVADRLTTVTTVRGGGYLPRLSFGIYGGTVVLVAVREARPSIQVTFEGLTVSVAPFDEIDLSAA